MRVFHRCPAFLRWLAPSIPVEGIVQSVFRCLLILSLDKGLKRCSFFLLLSCVAQASVLELPPLFTDHMVVQQGKAIAVWGWAAPRTEVRVRLAGKQARTEADAAGAWKIELPALSAGGPHSLAVESGEASLQLKDVLVGEVWLCGGQSNMQFSVKNTPQASAIFSQESYPPIRLQTLYLKIAGEAVRKNGGGWQPCSPASLKDFSAVGYFFGDHLHQELDCPIGLINCCWGGTTAEAWMSPQALAADPAFASIDQEYQQALKVYPEKLKVYEEETLVAWKAMVVKDPPWEPRPPMGPNHPCRPSGLHFGMLHAVAPYPLAGVIWYQGESNAQRWEQYRRLFPAMIKDWRNLWRDAELPFLFVQLANFMKLPDQPQAVSWWAGLRESQWNALSLAHTGMATAIDIGEAEDIHPRNKQEVGRRLALVALKKVYGKPVVCAGPEYDHMEIEGRQARIFFRHTTGGLKTKEGKAPARFMMAGEDGVFHWAQARIDGDQVLVFSEAVEQPTAVRYAWADNPIANLYNGAGLPALPFRSDGPSPYLP